MIVVNFLPSFSKLFSKLRDNSTKEKVLKQIEKIRANPEIGKPMRFSRKGTREVYIPPYRLSYIYLESENEVIIVDLYHKGKQ